MEEHGILKNFWPALVWAVVILVLTLMPGQYVPKMDYWNAHSIDKYIHFSIFLIQVWLLLWGEYKSRSLFQAKNYVLPILIGILFGVMIEFIQIYIPHRSYDTEDMIANSIGCILGAVLFILFRKIKKQGKVTADISG